MYLREGRGGVNRANTDIFHLAQLHLRKGVVLTVWDKLQNVVFVNFVAFVSVHEKFILAKVGTHHTVMETYLDYQAKLVIQP